MAKGYRRTARPTTPPQPHRAPTAPPEPMVAPERYPPPSHAAMVWLTGDGLRVSLPPARDEKGHAILLPTNPASWSILLDILRERHRASERDQRLSIGTRASPVQYDIEGMLRAMGQSAPTIRRIEKVEATSLHDLDLD